MEGSQRYNKLLTPLVTASSARKNLPLCLGSTFLSPRTQRIKLGFPKAGLCWAGAALAQRKKLEGTLKFIQIQPSSIQYCPPNLCDPSSCAPDVWGALISACTRAEPAPVLWVCAKGGINQQEEQTIPRLKHSKPRILGRLGGFLPRKVTFGGVGRLGSHFRPSHG